MIGGKLFFIPHLQIGDYVEINDHGGYIHEISMCNLVLKRPNWQFVVMPNSKFIEEPFINYSLIDRGKIAISFGVAYGTKPHSVKEMI